MRSAPLFLLMLLTSLTAPSAAAALVKCASDRGGVVYQDTPCPPGKELRDLEADPATLSVVPGTLVPMASAAARSRDSSTRALKTISTRTSARGAKSGNAAERRFIHNGMSEAEVIMRIGRPDVRSKGHGKSGGVRWSYLPVSGDADTLTTLTLAGGKVVDVERRVAR
jgi:hypothetical protein